MCTLGRRAGEEPLAIPRWRFGLVCKTHGLHVRDENREALAGTVLMLAGRQQHKSIRRQQTAQVGGTEPWHRSNLPTILS